MKLLKTDFSQSGSFPNNHNYSFSKSSKKRIKSDEFRNELEKFLLDPNEDEEEFKILLPKHGHFWDNGHEDVG